MIKFKLFFDLDTEEQWLKEMADLGYILEKKGLFYHFKNKTIEEPKTIRIDIRYFKTKEDYKEYIEIFMDAGWEYISGSYHSGVHYFMSDSIENNKLFSDSLSKGLRYYRLSQTYGYLLLIFFVLTLSMIINNTIDFSILLHPKELFITPGIWELNGVEKLWAVVFEIPFILVRFLYTYAVVILTGIIGYLSIKYYNWYKNEKDNSLYQ